jgi:hypothetical protein
MFNKLPPRPAYLVTLRNIFQQKDRITESELIRLSGLTKTQALCAIAELMRTQEIQMVGKQKEYALVLRKDDHVRI